MGAASADVAAEVSVVDLSQGDDDVLSTLKKACTSTGFFYVRNHGLDALMEEHFQMSKRFFQLPTERKLETMLDENAKGYTPMAFETLDPANQKAADTKECFQLGEDVGLDHPDAALPLHGPNIWPTEDLVPGFRASMEGFYDAAMAMSRRILRLLALSLDLPPAWFLDRFKRPLTTLRLLHYSAQPSDPNEGIFGCGAHSDYGVMTLLAVADGVPGLQIKRGEFWVDVPALPNTILVNLGDMLERWTNGLYKSTMHRVVTTSTRERYSSALFLDPDFNAVVDPAHVPSCCSAERPPAFEPITCGDYIMAKYNSTYQVAPASVAAAS